MASTVISTWLLAAMFAVRVVIDQTGYVPNMLAGALSSARSRLVAAIVPSVTNLIFLETVQALTDRLRQLEGDRGSMEAELADIGREADHIRRHALSTAVMADSYRDFPAILDRLTEAGQWRSIKELLARYVEVIDWHQGAGDPATGRCR